jgi:hypothetical protein
VNFVEGRCGSRLTSDLAGVATDAGAIGKIFITCSGAPQFEQLSSWRILPRSTKAALVPQ